MKDYPHVSPDLYRNTAKQSHVFESDWKHMEVAIKTGEVRKMMIGVQMLEEEVEVYRKLIEEFSDVFVWSYEKLKGILRNMVEHQIPRIPRRGWSGKRRGRCMITVVGNGRIIKIIKGRLH